MMKEYQLKECFKEVTLALGCIQDSNSLKSGDSILDLKTFSTMVSNLRSSRKFSEMVFLAQGLDMPIFTMHVSNPIKDFAKDFDLNSIIWQNEALVNQKRAMEILALGRNKLDIIMDSVKKEARYV